MNDEIWKWIKKFKNVYEISNIGQVRSFNKNTNGKIMKQNRNTKGYLFVELRKNKKRFIKKVHRLVMETFIGKSKLQVNHKDGNKHNNNLKNLEYVTCKQNIIHAWKIGLYKRKVGEDAYAHKLTNKKVKQIKKLLKDKISYSKIAKIFRVDPRTISFINEGKTWSHIK